MSACCIAPASMPSPLHAVGFSIEAHSTKFLNSPIPHRNHVKITHECGTVDAGVLLACPRAYLTHTTDAMLCMHPPPHHTAHMHAHATATDTCKSPTAPVHAPYTQSTTRGCAPLCALQTFSAACTSLAPKWRDPLPLPARQTLKHYGVHSKSNGQGHGMHSQAASNGNGTYTRTLPMLMPHPLAKPQTGWAAPVGRRRRHLAHAPPTKPPPQGATSGCGGPMP